MGFPGGLSAEIEPSVSHLTRWGSELREEHKQSSSPQAVTEPRRVGSHSPWPAGTPKNGLARWVQAESFFPRPLRVMWRPAL